jgi:hypothetical protein
MWAPFTVVGEGGAGPARQSIPIEEDADAGGT